MAKQIMKWAGGVTVFIGLLAYISNAAIRLNAIEEKSAKVPEMQKDLQIIRLYLKLVDPVNYEKAKELAK